MRGETAAILAETAERMEALPGHTGLYYRDLMGEGAFALRAEEPFLAASVIKLPLYLYILREAAAGRTDLTETLTVRQGDKVPVCGALTLFTGEPEVDLQTLCRLMISLSDNTATNLLIRRFGIEAVNGGFREMGLRTTALRRLLFDGAAAARGLENTVSPAEMGALLERLWRGTFVSPAVSAEALELLKLQQIDHKLGGMICGAAPIAHKTGEDDGLTSDVGIVFTPAPFLLCMTGHHTDVPAFETLIRETAWRLFREHQ